MKKNAIVPSPLPKEDQDCLKTHALIELFGHHRLVGLVTVDPPEFSGMVKVDIPDLVRDLWGHADYAGCDVVVAAIHGWNAGGCDVA